jgi:hypothetical protein
LLYLILPLFGGEGELKMALAWDSPENETENKTENGDYQVMKKGL